MDPQFQDFPVPQYPGASANADPLAAAAQTQQYFAANNALMYQQQAMLGGQTNAMSMNWGSMPQTIYDPSSGVVRSGPSQTLAIAQQNLMGGLQNVMMGTFAAGTQLSQQVSRMYGAGQRMMAPSQYNDVYLGPNNFALESSLRRELASSFGFTHETALGRLALGGFRPDFMTESEFRRQMEASWESRTVGAGVTGTLTGLEAAVTMKTGLVGSLIAAPVFGAIKRGVLSTEHYREQQAVASAWEEDALKRYGYGAGGFFDRTTSAGVAKSMEHHDVPGYAAAFLGKGISTKLGMRPEIQYEEVKKQMEELGMFSFRAGDFDKDKVMSGVKNIAEDMKWLAGLARTMKEEIPKLAAEIQRGTGLTFNDNRLQSLTRQVAQTASVTGLDAHQLAGAMSQSGQMGRAMGFGAVNLGADLMSTIQNTVSLQALGITPGLNAVSYAQNLQASYVQNARTNPLVMINQDGEGGTAGQKMNRFMGKMKDLNEWVELQYGPQSGANASSMMIKSIDTAIQFSREHGYKDLSDDSIARMQIARDNPNMSNEEQQQLFASWKIGETKVKELKYRDAVTRGLDTGEVERVLVEQGYSPGEAKQRAQELRAQNKDRITVGQLSTLHKKLGAEYFGPESSVQNSFFAQFGGREALENRYANRGNKVGADLRDFLKDGAIGKQGGWGQIILGATAANTAMGATWLSDGNWATASTRVMTNAAEAYAKEAIDWGDSRLSSYFEQRRADGKKDDEIKAEVAKLATSKLFGLNTDKMIESFTLPYGSEKIDQVASLLKRGEAQKAIDLVGAKGVMDIANYRNIDLLRIGNNLELPKNVLDQLSPTRQAEYRAQKLLQLVGGRESLLGARDAFYTDKIENNKLNAVVSSAYNATQGDEVDKVKAARSAYFSQLGYKTQDQIDSMTPEVTEMAYAGFNHALNKSGIDIHGAIYRETEKGLGKRQAKLDAIRNKYGSYDYTQDTKRYSGLVSNFLKDFAGKVDINSLSDDPAKAQQKIMDVTGAALDEWMSNKGDINEEVKQLRADLKSGKRTGLIASISKQALDRDPGSDTVSYEDKRKYYGAVDKFAKFAKDRNVQIDKEGLSDILQSAAALNDPNLSPSDKKELLSRASKSEGFKTFLQMQLGDEKGAQAFSQLGQNKEAGLKLLAQATENIGGLDAKTIEQLGSKLDASDQGRATEALNKFNSILEAIAAKMGVDLALPSGPPPNNPPSGAKSATSGSKPSEPAKEVPKVSVDHVLNRDSLADYRPK